MAHVDLCHVGHVGTNLGAAIASGDYVVDADAVADAILCRTRVRALAVRLASEVLSSAPLLERASVEHVSCGVRSRGGWRVAGGGRISYLRDARKPAMRCRYR